MNTDFIVYAVLLLLMSIAFCQQLFSEKINFYGVISLASISVYMGLNTIKNGINVMALILFVGSIFLIISEMFVPGGIMGILGTISLLSAVVLINKNTQLITFIILISVLAFVLLYLVNVYVFKKKLLLLNRLVLEDSISTEKGYVAKESQFSLLGESLVTLTDLRPAGIAIFNNIKYDVVSEGDFIEKNSQVIVTHVEGMRIVVRKK